MGWDVALPSSSSCITVIINTQHLHSSDLCHQLTGSLSELHRRGYHSHCTGVESEALSAPVMFQGHPACEWQCPGPLTPLFHCPLPCHPWSGYTPARLQPAQGGSYPLAFEDSGLGAYPGARSLCWVPEGRAALPLPFSPQWVWVRLGSVQPLNGGPPLEGLALPSCPLPLLAHLPSGEGGTARRRGAPLYIWGLWQVEAGFSMAAWPIRGAVPCPTPISACPRVEFSRPLGSSPFQKLAWS